MQRNLCLFVFLLNLKSTRTPNLPYSYVLFVVWFMDAWKKTIHNFELNWTFSSIQQASTNTWWKIFFFFFFSLNIQFHCKIIIEVTRVAFHVDFNPWATIENTPNYFPHRSTKKSAWNSPFCRLLFDWYIHSLSEWVNRDLILTQQWHRPDL